MSLDTVGGIGAPGRNEDQSGLDQGEPREELHQLDVRSEDDLGRRAARQPLRLDDLDRLSIRGRMRDQQVASGNDRVAQLGHEARWIVGVGYEVQDPREQYCDRLVEIQQAQLTRPGQDPIRLPQIGAEHRRPPVAGQQRLAVGHRGTGSLST